MSDWHPHAPGNEKIDIAELNRRGHSEDIGRGMEEGTPMRPGATLLARAAVHEDWSRPLPPATPTGLGPLDAIIGGLRAEAAYYLNAPTGRGKTGLTIQVTRHVALTMPVLYVSSELSRRQVLARVAAQHLSESWLDIYEMPPDKAPMIAQAVAESAPNLRVVKLDRSTVLSELLKAECDAIGSAPLLVLDYLQHAARRMSPSDYRIAMSMLSDEIARYTTDARAAAFIVSSVARGFYSNNENKTATEFLGTAKDSGDVEFDAAAVFFLDTEPCPPGGTSSARLHVAKSRFGAGGGTVGLRFDGRIGMFAPDPMGALTDDQRDVYETIKSGATSVEEVASSLHRRKSDVGQLIGVLAARGLIGKRPLCVLR